MTRTKLVWHAVLLVMVLMAVMAGGPQALPAGVAGTVVGSDPVQEDCNGNGIENQGCPKSSGDPTNYYCTKGTYNIVKAELEGTAINSRYNNDSMVCAATALNPCKRYTLKKVDSEVCKPIRKGREIVEGPDPNGN